MKTRLLFAAGTIAIAAVVIGIFAVSIEKKEIVSGVEGSALDIGSPFSRVDPIQDQAEPSTLTDTSSMIEFSMPSMLFDTIDVDYSHVNCAAVMNSKAIAGTDGGIFIYDPADSTTELISIDRGLTNRYVLSLLPDGDSLFIGTRSGLFVLSDIGVVLPAFPEIRAEITAMARGGDDIFLGTSRGGVLKISDGEVSVIGDKQCITAIQFGAGLVWAASEGEGLFCFDGRKWSRRYLEADSTAFDHVSSLGYKFNRLYAGTPDGMWAFDGGRWNLYDADAGLLVSDITSVAFQGWKILAATRDWGYYEVFEDWVTPIPWSEGLAVTCIASDGTMTVLGTPGSGIYTAFGRERVTNVNPGTDSLEIPIYASLFF